MSRSFRDGPQSHATGEQPSLDDRAGATPRANVNERVIARGELLPEQAGANPQDATQSYIVGVGASAGGLEALEKLFHSMPHGIGLSFVVVQHLSPDFKSHMDELLRRVTSLRVEVVTNGVEVAPDTIYLIPPNTEMMIRQGKLLLTERSADKSLNHPIDMFLRSLAQECQRYAVGIILSGTGSDGSRGIVEVAEHGGLVIAQDPASSKFDAMPLNAQETGKVHLVLPPEAIGLALQQYVSEGTHPNVLRDQQLGDLEETGLARVFQLLQNAHEIDFSNYKPGTVERRIKRRMELKGLTELDDYVGHLNLDRVEINELYKDLLIGVTRFFRDGEAFDYLQQRVLPRLVERFQAEELRVWVCGCATGEEAYSLAIALIEAYERLGIKPDFKMFATDAHKESLQFAAAGVFPENKLVDLPESRKQRFFRRRRDGYCVTAEVRKHVVFAPHNLINDPPFTQMHMVTCRNLLIYLQAAAQRKALSLFHFSLKQGGVLFLGPSESTGDLTDEFEALQANWKIFRKRRDIKLPLDMRLPMGQRTQLRGLSPLRAADAPGQRPADVLPSLYDMILGDMMPPSILVDAQFQVLHAFPGCEPYLRVVTGRPTTNVLELVYPELKNPLASAIQHALRDSQPVRYSGLPHPTDTAQQVRLVVRPYKPGTSAQTYLLLQFETMDRQLHEVPDSEFENVDLSQVAATRIEALEQDLSYTQQNLQATIEELETSNEELQATNEEMVASNEELQSTNEELHSVNEELYTVNAEHQQRVKELDEAHADMQNLLATTRVGVLFLDSELAIRRFTPAVGSILGMEQHDIGRDARGFLSRLEDPTIVDRLQQVLESQTEAEWEVACAGDAYLVRALPYRTGSAVAGVVVSLINISSAKHTEAALTRFKFMADENVDAQFLVDPDAYIVYANKQMASNLGYTLHELTSTSFMRFDVEHSLADFRRRFAEARQSGGAIFESTHARKDGSKFPVEIALTYVEFSGTPFLFGTIRDITSRRDADAQRRLLEQAIASVENGIVITDPHQADNPITFANAGFIKMTGYDAEETLGRNCRFLQGPDTDATAVEQIRNGLQATEPCRVLIRNYRKNGQPFWNDVYITPVWDPGGELIAHVGVQNDVTRAIDSGRLVEERERTIRLLLNSTGEGIYGLDTQGRCTFCNESALRMLGYEKSEQLIGRDMHALVHHHREDGSEYPREACPIFDVCQTGQPHHGVDDVFWRADGSSFPVEYWSHPLQENGTCTGAVLTFVDTTLRREELRELRQAQESADAANAAKSHFLANVSHELRTPLAAMLGFTQILEEEQPDPVTAERLRTIKRNGEYLLRLLNDVLDLSRIEAGKFQTSKTITRLEDLLGDVQQTMAMRADDNKTQLEFQLENPLPSTLSTDPSRVRQILINLIGNAIKFAPGGQVEVRVRSDKDQDGDVLCFEVRDNGIGISEEQLKHLFQPFVQANSSIVKRFGGSGLGLSITKRLVEVLAGEIEVESRQGQGSCFTVCLPLRAPGELKEIVLDATAPPAAAPGTRVVEVQGQLRGRVLVADDMRDIRLVAQHFLVKAGCEVAIAEHGRQAAEMVQQAIDECRPFDLVLMDLQMPEMDGESALKHLRQAGHDVPVVALTADAMKGTRRRVLEAGFDEYLTKPLSVPKLLRVTQTLIDRAKNRDNA